MDVSENSGTPKSSILIGFSINYKPSILGYPYFWKHPFWKRSLTCRESEEWKNIPFSTPESNYCTELVFKYYGTGTIYCIKTCKLLNLNLNQPLKRSHWPSLTATPSTAGGSSETISKHLPKLCVDDNDDPIQWQTPFPSAQIVVLCSRTWSMKYSPQVFPNKAFLLNQPFWAS